MRRQLGVTKNQWVKQPNGLFTKPTRNFPTQGLQLYVDLRHPDQQAIGSVVNGTGVATGAPVTLAIGNNTITITTQGTFTVYVRGSGTATSGTATVTGSPQTLVSGHNTVTVTGTGNITVALNDVITDKSPNAALLTVTGSPVWSNQGRTFGSGKYISVPDSAVLSAMSTYTILVWMKRASHPSGFEGLISKRGTGATTIEWSMAVNSSGVLEFTQFGGGVSTNYLYSVGTKDVCDNVAHIVGVTWNGTNAISNMPLYADGAIDTLTTNSKVASGGTTYDSAIPVELGRMLQNNTYSFGGLEGEAWIYNRVLSAQESNQTYLATKGFYGL